MLAVRWPASLPARLRRRLKMGSRYLLQAKAAVVRHWLRFFRAPLPKAHVALKSGPMAKRFKFPGDRTRRVAPHQPSLFNCHPFIRLPLVVKR